MSAVLHTRVVYFNDERGSAMQVDGKLAKPTARHKPYKHFAGDTHTTY
eukprot:jgi/Botrbrau1/19347/Bobra.0073s0072.1